MRPTTLDPAGTDQPAHPPRRVEVPPVSYPDLPVAARRDDIAAAIRDHQVVVVAGETGSG
jgi:ATP-dependent helicase HrpA